MNLRRTGAIALKSLGQLANDRRTLVFVLVVPLVLIVVFGYGFGGQPTHIPTAVDNSDAGPGGALLLAHLPAGTLDLRSVSSESAAHDQVRSGSAAAAIVIPANFSQDWAAGNASIRVYVDGTSPTVVAAVMAAIQQAVQQLLGEHAGPPPLTVQPDYVYGGPDTSFIDSLAPGVMALVAVFATTILAILVLVRERARGLLERLFATPLRPSEFVAGHALSLALVGAGQSIVVLLASILIFQASFAGSIPLALALLVLFALGNIGLGMLISALAQSEFQAVQLIPLLIFPQLLFSGALFPIDSIPLSFRPVAQALPLTYAADALRSVLLRGGSVGMIGGDLAALLAYAVLTLGGAALLVRRQR